MVIVNVSYVRYPFGPRDKESIPTKMSALPRRKNSAARSAFGRGLIFVSSVSVWQVIRLGGSEKRHKNGKQFALCGSSNKLSKVVIAVSPFLISFHPCQNHHIIFITARIALAPLALFAASKRRQGCVEDTFCSRGNVYLKGNVGNFHRND